MRKACLKFVCSVCKEELSVSDTDNKIECNSAFDITTNFQINPCKKCNLKFEEFKKCIEFIKNFK